MSKKRWLLHVVIYKIFENGAPWFLEKTAVQLLGGA